MIKVFLLILWPAQAWEKIVLARRGYVWIVATLLLPLLVAGGAAESWGLLHWGKWQPKFEVIKRFTPDQVVIFEAGQFVALVATVLLCALIVLRVSQTFHERNRYLEAFTLTAYGFGPILLLHLLDVLPGMSPWVTWGTGMALAVWTLYQGIPRVLQPDPTHAFGLYLSTLMVMVLASGLERTITGLYLLGYVGFDHSWLTREVTRFLNH